MVQRPLSLLLCAALLLPASPLPSLAGSLKAQEAPVGQLVLPTLAGQAGPLAQAGSFGPASGPAAFTQPGAALTLPAAAVLPSVSQAGAAQAQAQTGLVPGAAASSSLKAAPQGPAASSDSRAQAQPQVRAAVSDSGVFDGSSRRGSLGETGPVAGAYGSAKTGLTASSGGSQTRRDEPSSPSAKDSVLPRSKAGSPFSWLRKAATAVLLGAAMLLSSCAKEDIEPGPYPDGGGIEAYHITYEQIWEDIEKTPASATLPPNDYIDKVRTHDNDLVYRTRVNSHSELTAYLEGIDGAKIDLLLVDDSGNILARDNNLTDPYFYENGFAADVPPGDYFLIIHNNDDTGVGQTTYFEWTIDPK